MEKENCKIYDKLSSLVSIIIIKQELVIFLDGVYRKSRMQSRQMIFSKKLMTIGNLAVMLRVFMTNWLCGGLEKYSENKSSEQH